MSRRLADLVGTVTEAALRPVLDGLFPDETAELLAVFRQLRSMEAVPNVGLILRLDRDDGEVFVGATDTNTGEEVALDLCPWRVYLGLEVPDGLLAEFTPEEIVAHAIGEMTFYGSTEATAADNLRQALRLKPSGADMDNSANA